MHGRSCPPSLCSVNFEEDSKKLAKLIGVMKICQRTRMVSAQPDAEGIEGYDDHLRRLDDGLRGGDLQDGWKGYIRHDRGREGIEMIEKTMAVERAKDGFNDGDEGERMGKEKAEEPWTCPSREEGK